MKTQHPTCNFINKDISELTFKSRSKKKLNKKYSQHSPYIKPSAGYLKLSAQNIDHGDNFVSPKFGQSWNNFDDCSQKKPSNRKNMLHCRTISFDINLDLNKKGGESISDIKNQKNQDEFLRNTISNNKENAFHRRFKSIQFQLQNGSSLTSRALKEKRNNFKMKQQKLEENLSLKKMKMKKKFPQFKELIIDDFQLGLYRREDSLGKLYPAKHIQTGFICCIKVVGKQEGKNIKEHLIKDIKAQMFSESKHIISIYGIFDDRKYIYIIMQYHEEGTLHSKVMRSTGLPEKKALYYLGEISKGVRILHNNKIKSGKIKSSSISCFYESLKLSILHSQYNEKSYEEKSMKTNENKDEATNIKANLLNDIHSLGEFFFEMLIGTRYYKLSKHSKGKLFSLKQQKSLKQWDSFKLHEKIISQIFQRIFTNSEDKINDISELINAIEKTQKHFQ